MSLTHYKQHFDNAYQEVFQKVLVAKKIANLRFENVLTYGESIERVAYDIDSVRVRDVNRVYNGSTIDSLSDSSELLEINLNKEAVFYISDEEVKQAGPLNPGTVIGGKIARKVAEDFDARVLAETLNAHATFDEGDLTTLSSNGTPFALNNVNVPLFITRALAKLQKNNQSATNLAIVVDAYGASAITNYIISKDIDLAGATFKNGYAGKVMSAELYVSENLTGTAELTATGNLADGETITINGVVFTAKTAVANAGDFLIGADANETLTNLANLINNPETTNANQVALSTADQITIQDALRLEASVNGDVLTVKGIGSGRLVVSETSANASWGNNTLHCYFGKKGAIDAVLQDMKEVDMRKTSGSRGTNVFSSYLGGVKTFSDGAQKFLDVLVDANV